MLCKTATTERCNTYDVIHQRVCAHVEKKKKKKKGKFLLLLLIILRIFFFFLF